MGAETKVAYLCAREAVCGLAVNAETGPTREQLVMAGSLVAECENIGQEGKGVDSCPEGCELKSLYGYLSQE